MNWKKSFFTFGLILTGKAAMAAEGSSLPIGGIIVDLIVIGVLLAAAFILRKKKQKAAPKTDEPTHIGNGFFKQEIKFDNETILLITHPKTGRAFNATAPNESKVK